MTVWQLVLDERSYGVVIYNFTLTNEYKIKLNCGDRVHILEECTDWYRGYALNDPYTIGIFPKTYIHVIECIVQRDDTDITPVFILKQTPIVQEITVVLREWGMHLKQLYVMRNKNFDLIHKQMYELINHRSKILSETLPIDEVKDITKRVTTEIDVGNKILGLDMTIRDKDGNPLNSDTTSTLQLYYNHKNVTDRINSPKTECMEDPRKSAVRQYSHIFIVFVKNFTGKLSEDAELLMTLYDAKEGKTFTENYVVQWSKDGLMSDIDQIFNLKVMFTDLGKKDLEREKIYFVCYVIRIGSMDMKEVDHRRSSMSAAVYKKNAPDNMRRPFGVAAKDITHFINGKLDSDLEQEYQIPFYNCEKDNLEQTLRKIANKDTKTDNKNQNLFVSMKLLHGDLRQVKEENPHLVLGSFSVARKMGFPEVILPGDVRNDLYLTIIQGEFLKGNKTSDKNVEVTVKVCNDKGVHIPGVISVGGGASLLNEYRSVIYYHEYRPQWYETFKIVVPIEEFKTSHLKFFFKHRSSNEAKDKSEKPFAMSYIQLMQPDGTTLKDDKHNLIVYKIDNKKFVDDNVDYFALPSTVDDFKTGSNKPHGYGLSYSVKESFVISTNICSTKLTQNANLLKLLNWSSHKESLEDSLKSLQNVVNCSGEEVVKFFQDILDALFDILMYDHDENSYDELVFQCLLSVISLVSNNWKYAHFEPVLDLYIKESFSATLAYKKLITILKNCVERSESAAKDVDKDFIFKTMKCLQYLMKFITRSRLLYIELHQGEGNNDFEVMFKNLMHSIIKMMCHDSDSLLREQGACLKYLPSIIPDVLMVFKPQLLSTLLCNLLTQVPAGRLTKQKMMTINDIVHSELFLHAECRQVFMPYFAKQIQKLFEQAEEVELCIKILSDILDLLSRKDVGPTYNDLSEIMVTDLRSVMQTHIYMDKQSPHAANLVAILIDIFRQMSNEHYEKYIKQFTKKLDLKDFLMEILLVFKELVNESVFPPDWSEMILLQNFIILKALRFFSRTIMDYFFEQFDLQAWNNFFHCAIAFLTQPSLQLENFSQSKRLRLIKRYKDMRRDMGFEIRLMWFNLGQHKLKFIPGLVGLILEMTLIPETELRKATIPIFFDMMQCEFYSSKYEFESFGDTKRDSSHIKGNFDDFENEMIVKLDTLVEGGRGDENYKNLFYDIMMRNCSAHNALKDGCRFVEMISRLMERLLEYRCIIHDENKENRMSCTVNLLDFYSEINRKEMYIRYVNKLCDLHVECDNYTEAAFTLELHSNLLNWSDDSLPPLLKTDRYSNLYTHRELKEALYITIIEYYSKGKMWECALEKCQELVKQYEEETFEYEKLSNLHKNMAHFYDDIMKHVRPEPEYFRVGYYGLGFPQFLQNKVSIYRGKEYERLTDFSNRVLNEFPNAKALNKLTLPGPEILESNAQYIQINKVEPVMDENNHRFSGKAVSEQIIKYYKVNHVNKFKYNRPFTRKDPDVNIDNEFASLWLERTVLTTTYPLPGILRWFPVSDVKTYEVSPLRNAIETMENKNKELRDLILLYNKDKTLPVNPLSLKLTGIVDPAVMGGIMNYEEAFFTPEYSEVHADEQILIQKLKDLIAEQIPLLDLCVQLHKERAEVSLYGLHKRIEECFNKMQESVIEKYGKKVCDLKIDTSSDVTIRRHYSITSLMRPNSDNEKSSPYSLSKNSLLLSPTRSLTVSNISQKHRGKGKDKRKLNKSESTTSPNIVGSATQWYTLDNDNNVCNGPSPFELRQKLTPQRPLRSEVEKEKRISRINSGQYSRPSSLSLTIRATNSSGNSSNRDSVGTTDSSVSEEDAAPPPLPVKLRENDDCTDPRPRENISFLHSSRSSDWSKIHSEIHLYGIDPPPMPPKPPKKKYI